VTAQPLDWARVTELFTATFEAAPEERLRVLDAEAGHPELRRRVEELLAAHDAADGVLDRPAISSLDGLDLSSLTPVASLVGRMLGPYKVIREIARGGMGAVYEGARHDAQFDQRVAIKTLRIGADSEAILQRFRQERRILAALHHPNIAALYDGGVTEEGLPYFVLEYVDGKPIDEACAELQLELPARLDWFRQVVSAVQYAHGQLVIHRDLKPSNILVTRDGVVKLVDFGIAKLLEHEGSELTADTRGPLTIPYASPEQVKGDSVTTATDIYSLGVVLYRLLAGRNPFDVDHLSLERAVTTICSVTPPLPSEAASAERLRRQLRGELDAIVMVALRKEPERRYATVQSLGDDLQRYLRGQPVTAAPDTMRYRVSKFVRRRRGLVFGGAFGAVALVAGAGVAVWQAQSARREARRATEVSHFLEGVIGAGELTATSTGPRLGPTASVAQLLDSAALRVSKEFADDPQSRARIHLALGKAYFAQTRMDEARAQFDSVRLILGRQFGDRRLEIATALANLAAIAFLRGDTPRDDSLVSAAIRIYESLHQTNTAEYAELLHARGLYFGFHGKWQKADTLVGEAFEIHQSIGSAPTIPKALTLADLTAIEESDGRQSFTQAGANYRRALAMLDSVPGREVLEKATVLWYAARAAASQGRLREADSLSTEELRVAERASGPLSTNVLGALAQRAETRRYLGDSASGRQDIDRAIELLRSRSDIVGVGRERVLMEFARYLELGGQLSAADSVARIVYQGRLAAGNAAYVAEAGEVLGSILVAEHHYAEAEAVLVDAYRKLANAVSTSHPFARTIAISLVRLYEATHRPALAKPYLAILPDSVQRALEKQEHRPGS
jgi:serine/threonine-protein kinase